MIQVENVSMRFRMGNDRIGSLKEYAIATVKGRLRYRDFWVFREVSFTVERGEVVGIIGKNGAGKSTLLKLIAGVLTPTEGKVVLEGKIVPMLELGSGFDLELSGRENIFLNGAILGYGRAFLEEKYQEILEFSELQEFIDMPIRNYSSGMLMRLAFSIATIVKPEILIVDEILAVGDEAFQKKSKRKMLELMSGGTTVLFVSHSMEQIRELCSRVVWLENGRIRQMGETKRVCDAYQEAMHPTMRSEALLLERKRNHDAEKYMMDLLLVYGDVGEDYEWRVHNQKEQLLAGNMPAAEIYYQDLTEHLLAKYRVFFFVGCPATTAIVSFLWKLKNYHKTVLVDCSGVKEWNENRIYLEGKGAIDGIVAATKEAALAAEKEGYSVYLNPDVCSDRVEQLSEWAVYDRDQLPYLDAEQFTGDQEVLQYYRAVKKKEERETRKRTLGCLENEAEVRKELLDAILSWEPEAEIYLGRTNPPKVDKKTRMDGEGYGKHVHEIESMEQERLPALYAEFDLLIGRIQPEREERKMVQQRIYAGLVKTPFFIWKRSEQKNAESDSKQTEERQENAAFETEQTFEIEAETAKEFYQNVRRQYQEETRRKEIVERTFCQVKKERTAIHTGWRFAKWVRTMETPQAVFLLKEEMAEEEKDALQICARECFRHGMDVLLLWERTHRITEQEQGGEVPLLEASRTEVSLYISFDRVIASSWEDCEFLQTYPDIKQRIFLQQREKMEEYCSGDYRRFRMMQRYAPCVEMECYMRKEFWERYAGLFGEQIHVKLISSKAEAWYEEIFISNGKNNCRFVSLDAHSRI